MTDAFRIVDITRVRGGVRSAEVDRAATEEPLEIRLHGRPFAVIMRTPGADRELTAGFLLSERVVRSADDLGAIAYCTQQAPADPLRPDYEDRAQNVVDVTLADGAGAELDRLLEDRRQVMGNSSCGLCGRLTIESLRAGVPPIDHEWTIARSTLARLPERLRKTQLVFDETGGLHAAGLFTREGELEVSAEDVGRHNAVDKVIGRMLIGERLPLSGHLLCVSGRASFEIVQKALLAGIPLVASVSAPSSLAIDLARESGITLVGFVRGDGFNVYAHPARVGG
jgi:FdhD protein